MNQKLKLLESFLANPTSFRFPQIQKILLLTGFLDIKVRGGSHRKFKHPLRKSDLTIPVHNNDCKNCYKEITAKAIKEVTKKE